VDRVAQCLEREFLIDRDNTIDRRATLEPDRFGYLSLHHVASLRPDRTYLLEYRRFSGLKFEVQTRSILQHAWAEMEHDLGYKTLESVPREARRRFSSLAGLLEIADREFGRLRDELEKYRQNVPRKIASNPQDVEIDKDSLNVFLQQSSVVKEIDQAIINTVPSSYMTSVTYSPYIAKAPAILKFVGVTKIEELNVRLRRNKQLIPTFAHKFVLARPGFGAQGAPVVHFVEGTSVIFLAYIIAARELDVQALEELVLKGTIAAPSKASEVARRILKTYESISDDCT
jgi:putative GTP pyrophosphokinase